MPPFSAIVIIFNRLKVGGSVIGSPDEVKEMLDFAAKKKIKPWIQMKPMKDANKIILDFEKGTPRYRSVLVNQ
jgi:alcohol dehydrogenase (NADP+)